MNTQDETIIREGKTAAESTAANKRNASRWQTVSIGGVTGIVMGMAATRAYDAFAADQKSDVTDAEETTANVQMGITEESATVAAEVHQATTSQGLSFSDAFAAARAEVGPGGVFMWHGRLYNTYTAAEWNAMSDAQKNEFADNVQPLLGQQTVEAQTVVHQTVHHNEETDVHVHINGNQVHVHLEEEQEQPRKVEVSVEEQEPTQEPEVHFLGVDSREIEGQTVSVGVMTIGNDAVAYIDVDNDQVFDIKIQDENRNNKIEDEEIEDVSDRNLSVDGFRVLSALDEMASQTGEPEQACNVQEDLAPDMPDYMNDADLGTT